MLDPVSRGYIFKLLRFVSMQFKLNLIQALRKRKSFLDFAQGRTQRWVSGVETPPIWKQKQCSNG